MIEAPIVQWVIRWKEILCTAHHHGKAQGSCCMPWVLAFLHPFLNVPLCFWVYPPRGWSHLSRVKGDVRLLADEIFGRDDSCKPLSTRSFLHHALGFII